MIEVERAQFFRARAELKLQVSSPDKPEPAKISLKPAMSPILLYIKTVKFKLQPALRFSEIQACWASSLGLIYCKPKIRPGPSSSSPGSFHL